MNKNTLFKKASLAVAGLFFSSALWAHGGAAGTDTDQCKFELEKGHWIHYTAYQPTAYPAEEFCGSLPALNVKTQLVFDYQDMRYRNRMVEFEVTKEPEGTRVFYLEPAKHKGGSVVLDLPQGVAEKSKYLIHITLLPEQEGQGDRLDAHMSFMAGTGEATSRSQLGLYILFAFAGLYGLYLSSSGFKNQIDKLFGRIKE